MGSRDALKKLPRGAQTSFPTLWPENEPYHEAFWRLSRFRQQGFASAQAITVMDILAYSMGTGLPFESMIIRLGECELRVADMAAKKRGTDGGRAAQAKGHQQHEGNPGGLPQQGPHSS